MAGGHGSGEATETSHHHESPLATYLTHVFAGTFLGLLVAVVMAMLHNISPFPALERAGSDAAQRMFAYTVGEEAGRPIVAAIRPPAVSAPRERLLKSSMLCFLPVSAG